MVELIIRLMIAGAIAYSARQTGTPAIEWTYPVVGAYAFWTLLSFALGRRWLALGSSLQALGDAAAIGIFAGVSGALNSFGFLAAIPVVYAISRRQAHPLVATAAGLSMYLGFFLFAKGVPALDFHAKAIAMTLAGSFAIPRRMQAESTDTVDDVEDEILPYGAEVVLTLSEENNEELIALKDSHARLLERYHLLENERQREIALRNLATFRPLISPLPELCSRIAGVTESEAVALYVRSESADDLVVQGTFGDWPDMLRDTAIPLIPGENAENSRWALESQVSGLVGEGHHACAILEREQRVIGLVVVRSKQEQAVRLHEMREAVTTIVIEDAEARRSQSRLREAEILYSVASVTQGAQTRESLAERVVRELSTLVKADGLTIVWTEGDSPEVVSTSGVSFDPGAILSMEGMSGVEGWLCAGSPEIAAFRTLKSMHCNPTNAMRERIGSLILIPLQSGTHPFGFLAAFTHRAGGLDTADLLSLRTIGIEVSRSLARIAQSPVEEGLVTPTDFHNLTRGGGAIVYIEPIRTVLGSADLDQAIRQFAHVVRGKLPPSGIVCRRDQGDLLAFLNDQSYDLAMVWANEIQALASMVSVDGRPLAVRTKVAHLPNRVISAA